MKPALLLIDLQRYFMESGSAEKVARVPTLIAKANELIDFFHDTLLPVVRVQIVHKADGSTWDQAMRPHWAGQPMPGTLTEGTWEADMQPDLHGRPADLVVTKTRGSAFVRTNLEALLRGLGIDTVILAGFSTNRCVGLTAIDAWERDFAVLLAGEAILGTNLTDGNLMLDYLRKAFHIEPVSNAEIKKAIKAASGVEDASGPTVGVQTALASCKCRAVTDVDMAGPVYHQPFPGNAAMHLEKASERVPPGLEELLREIGDGEDGFSGTSFGRGDSTLERFLQACRDGEHQAKIGPGLVPQTVFWMIDDRGHAVGMVRARHRLNERLLQHGGHVGYYVCRAERGKGYAKAALRFAVSYLQQLGVPRILVTVRPTNMASIRTVLANNGTPDGQCRDPDCHAVVNRYWIEPSS